MHRRIAKLTLTVGRCRSAMGIVAFCLIFAGLASNARAQQIIKDEKKTGKYSTTFVDVLEAKPKGLCVCLDPGLDTEFDNTLGLITRRTKIVTVQFLGEDREVIEVKCQPIAYDLGTGDRDTTAIGCTDWVPLAK